MKVIPCLVVQILRNRGKICRKQKIMGLTFQKSMNFFDVELEDENWSKLDAALKEINDKLDAVLTTK